MRSLHDNLGRLLFRNRLHLQFLLWRLLARTSLHRFLSRFVFLCILVFADDLGLHTNLGSVAIDRNKNRLRLFILHDVLVEGLPEQRVGDFGVSPYQLRYGGQLC